MSIYEVNFRILNTDVDTLIKYNSLTNLKKESIKFSIIHIFITYCLYV